MHALGPLDRTDPPHARSKRAYIILDYKLAASYRALSAEGTSGQLCSRARSRAPGRALTADPPSGIDQARCVLALSPWTISCLDLMVDPTPSCTSTAAPLSRSAPSVVLVAASKLLRPLYCCSALARLRALAARSTGSCSFVFQSDRWNGFLLCETSCAVALPRKLRVSAKRTLRRHKLGPRLKGLARARVPISPVTGPAIMISST